MAPKAAAPSTSPAYVPLRTLSASTKLNSASLGGASSGSSGPTSEEPPELWLGDALVDEQQGFNLEDTCFTKGIMEEDQVPIQGQAWAQQWAGAWPQGGDWTTASLAQGLGLSALDYAALKSFKQSCGNPAWAAQFSS